MKKFSRHLTHDELKKQCKKLKVPFDDHLYRERGWDTVVVGELSGAHVIYNVWNGKFFGRTPHGRSFSSSDTNWKNAPWFWKLLNFFYVE